MNQKMKPMIFVLTCLCVLSFVSCAFAGTWTARFSIDDVRPVSPETEDMLTERLEDTFGSEDPETGYTYSFQIVGEAEIEGKMWYVGRLSWLVEDHLSLLSDFLMDQENLRVYYCTYPDSETIECEDDEETQSEIVGEVAQPIPYLSENGFSLCYDAAYFEPDDDETDRFVAVWESDVFFSIAVVDDLPKESYDDFLAEAYYNEEPLVSNIEIGDGVQSLRAVVERDGRAEYYYLVEFGSDALAISAVCPADEEGDWGARFDLMVESLTF